MTITALVLGLVATLFPFLYSLSPNLIVAAIPLGLIALLLAIFARRSALKHSRSTLLATIAVGVGILPLLVSTAILVFYSHLTADDKPFVAHDPNQAQKLEQDRAVTARSFDDLVNKALKAEDKQ